LEGPGGGGGPLNPLYYLQVKISSKKCTIIGTTLTAKPRNSSTSDDTSWQCWTSISDSVGQYKKEIPFADHIINNDSFVVEKEVFKICLRGGNPSINANCTSDLVRSHYFEGALTVFNYNRILSTFLVRKKRENDICFFGTFSAKMPFILRRKSD
jgi:hypothetical protein